MIRDVLGNEVKQMGKSHGTWGNVGAIVLIALGVLLLVDQFVDVSLLGSIWPLVIVGIGVHMLMRAKGREGGKTK